MSSVSLNNTVVKNKKKPTMSNREVLSRTSWRCVFIISFQYNADEFLEADGVRVVTDLACLAHLHTSRAPVPTATNVLKGDSEKPDAAEGGGTTQREWWYWKTGDPKGSSEGPFTFAEVFFLLLTLLVLYIHAMKVKGLDFLPPV